MNKLTLEKMCKFDDYFRDGSFVVNGVDNKVTYDARKALKKVKKLGRPLTSKEMKEFEMPIS